MQNASSKKNKSSAEKGSYNLASNLCQLFLPSFEFVIRGSGLLNWDFVLRVFYSSTRLLNQIY